MNIFLECRVRRAPALRLQRAAQESTRTVPSVGVLEIEGGVISGLCNKPNPALGRRRRSPWQTIARSPQFHSLQAHYLAAGSEDPADPEKTARVLTIMRADEYWSRSRKEAAIAAQQPSYTAYTVIKREGQDDYWIAIGAAWMHQDGDGYNVILQALPLDGKIVLRPPKADTKSAEVQGAQQAMGLFCVQ
jgi:hypothetical protein